MLAAGENFGTFIDRIFNLFINELTLLRPNQRPDDGIGFGGSTDFE